jgi:diguanylate cyclase (GGDEF)-like protein
MSETLTPLPPEAEEFHAPTSDERREYAPPQEIIRRPEPLTSRDYELLQSLSQRPIEDMTAAEVDMFELLLKLQDHAFRDDLTGLQNRKAFNREVERERVKPREQTQDTHIFVIDINNFKQFNTRYGHLGGDVVLQHIAAHIGQIVGETLRQSDVALRYAGDEFCVIAQTSHPDILASRLYEAVANNPVEIEGQLVNLTISIGYSKREDDDSDLRTTFGRADDALLNIAKAKKGHDEPTIGYYGEELDEQYKPKVPPPDVLENMGG